MRSVERDPSSHSESDVTMSTPTLFPSPMMVDKSYCKSEQYPSPVYLTFITTYKP